MLEYKPPLARELFDIEHHDAHWQVLYLYPGARWLTQQLARRIGAGDFYLEAELRSFAEHRDPQIRNMFKHIPPYLRDLLKRSSDSYTQEPGSYIALVYQLLSQVPQEVLFLVLNYDNLLEKALVGLDSSYRFNKMSDYVAPDRQAKVVKLHGSINWFKRIGSQRLWLELVELLDIFEKAVEKEIEVIDHVIHVLEHRDNLGFFYPILTAPLAGKSTLDFVSPESHINAAKEFLGTCKKFLIIGTSGRDEDLLSLLNTSTPPESHPYVHMVGDNGAREAFERFSDSVRAFAATGSLSETHENGFRAYVSSQHLERFAAMPVE